VVAHGDELFPAGRFSLVWLLVAVFHVAGAFAADRFPTLATALHRIGTIATAADIFLSAPNLQPAGAPAWRHHAVRAGRVLGQRPAGRPQAARNRQPADAHLHPRARQRPDWTGEEELGRQATLVRAQVRPAHSSRPPKRTASAPRWRSTRTGIPPASLAERPTTNDQRSFFALNPIKKRHIRLLTTITNCNINIAI
jgi:hypothetical protein